MGGFPSVCSHQKPLRFTASKNAIRYLLNADDNEDETRALLLPFFLPILILLLLAFASSKRRRKRKTRETKHRPREDTFQFVPISPHNKVNMDEDVLPHPPRGVLLSAVCDSNSAASYRDYFEDVSKCVPYSSSSSYSSSSGDSWETDEEEEEDDDGVFLRITKAYEQQNNNKNEKPAVQVSFVNIHDVIDANSPNEYAQTAQRIERVKARCKEKRIGLVFCTVSPMREERKRITRIKKT